MKLGDVLKRERTKRRLSETAMANVLRMPVSDYRKLESGRHGKVPAGRLQEWETTLGVDLEQALDDDP